MVSGEWRVAREWRVASGEWRVASGGWWVWRVAIMVRKGQGLAVVNRIGERLTEFRLLVALPVGPARGQGGRHAAAKVAPVLLEVPLLKRVVPVLFGAGQSAQARALLHDARLAAQRRRLLEAWHRVLGEEEGGEVVHAHLQVHAVLRGHVVLVHDPRVVAQHWLAVGSGLGSGLGLGLGL